MAHYDVVPAGDPGEWTQAPFSGHNDGTFLWGRGTLDDKGQLVAVLEAAESLLRAGYAPTPRSDHHPLHHDGRHRLPPLHGICGAVYRFAPFFMDVPARGSIHAVDEKIALETLGHGVRFYETLMREL